MFIREKKNRSGSVSIQLLEKRGRRNFLIKSFGASSDPVQINRLKRQAQEYATKIKGQLVLNFDTEEEQSWFDEAFSAIQKVQLIGPELILGQLYDAIGFDQIPTLLFKHLVLSRIIYPSSKLKTVRYLEQYEGVFYDVQQIYRYMDKLHQGDKERVENISYAHTRSILGDAISIVFYDVTTIYFEAEQEDEMRKAGFSKEGKHKHPQILLGLLVSVGGYPLAYEIFEGNKYEGHTMLPVIDKFKERFDLKQLIIVADAGLMTNANISELIDRKEEFIIGARIKNESKTIKEKILSHRFTDGQNLIIRKKEGIRLIVNYSKKRASKDVHNRSRGLKRLEKALTTGKLTKRNINNRGYNKYLKLTGQIQISIDYDKYERDSKWDGLKGFLTNTTLNPKVLLDNYRELWQIEKAFRISKTDLRIRPIYHRLHKRIAAHICISFAAYKVYKELERQLQLKQDQISPQRAIEAMKTIYGITLQHPSTKNHSQKIFYKSEIQAQMLNLFNIQT